MSSTIGNSALPSVTSYTNGTAAFDPATALSAFTTTGWNYIPALTPSLLSTAFTDGAEEQTYALGALANLGAQEFAAVNTDYAGWAGSQDTFLTSVTNIFQQMANNSAKASTGGGIFGFIGL